MKHYPHARDIILLDFNPQSGHEIQKKRPALVLSNDAFNRMTGLAMVCPITSTQRDFPLHVALDDRTSVHGDILCEQLKSLDYQSRDWKFLEPCPEDLFQRALAIVDTILGE